MRVAFVLRSAEVQLLFRRFVRDLSSVFRHSTRLVNSPPPPKHNQQQTPTLVNTSINNNYNNNPKHNQESLHQGVLVVYTLLGGIQDTCLVFLLFFFPNLHLRVRFSEMRKLLLTLMCSCMVCMIQPGGWCRLQTYRSFATQRFNSSLRTFIFVQVLNLYSLSLSPSPVCECVFLIRLGVLS